MCRILAHDSNAVKYLWNIYVHITVL